MKLKKNEKVGFHSKKGRALLNDEPHFTLVSGGVGKWLVSARGKYRKQRLHKYMSSKEVSYSKALEEGMRLAKFYNMPLVKWVQFGKFQIVWAPEPDGELARLRRARFFRGISEERRKEKNKRKKKKK